MQSQKTQIKWPSAKSLTINFIVIVVGMMLFNWIDGARGFAFILWPVMVASWPFREMNTTWKEHYWLKLSGFAAAAIWIAAGFFVLSQIISIEDGNPMIKEGWFYETTKQLAKVKE